MVRSSEDAASPDLRTALVQSEAKASFSNLHALLYLDIQYGERTSWVFMSFQFLRVNDKIGKELSFFFSTIFRSDMMAACPALVIDSCLVVIQLCQWGGVLE